MSQTAGEHDEDLRLSAADTRSEDAHLGLNAAAGFGVDPNAVLNQVLNDGFFSRMRAAYLEEGPQPSLTQYGWVLRA